jgi:anti-sigma regulatory factor (Ser/Thr protein kinase)
VTERGMIGPVEIRVPPDPSLSRVLRLAASGVASLAAYTVDEIDDIKIAVSEVLIALIEHGRGEPIDVQFVVDAHTFTVRGRTPMEGFDVNDPDLRLCRTVLEGVCAEHGIDQVDSNAQIWATVEHLSI